MAIQIEDRRRVTIRLSILQYVITVMFSVLAVGFWVLQVVQVPTRQYPETMAAHLFGYVGEVNDAQVSESDGLKSGDIVGQSGVEKTYNAMLMGSDGSKRVVVNSVGREIRTLEEEEPTEGKRLQLTVDYDVQKVIEDGFDQL